MLYQTPAVLPQVFFTVQRPDSLPLFPALPVLNPLDQITEKVYLGDESGASSEEILRRLNIKKVVTCNNTLPVYFDKSIRQKFYNMMDIDSENLFKYFYDLFTFIEDSNDKVLIHCFAGRSRSAALTIAYIMWKYRMSFSDAYTYVRKHRLVSPNFGFVRQLQLFDVLLKRYNYDINKIYGRKRSNLSYSRMYV